MELIAGKMLGFILVSIRLGAFFSIAPVFSWQSIPNNIKLAMAILISIFFASINSSPLNGMDISIIELLTLMANEAIYGLALGIIAICLFSIVKIAAQIIERQMGLAMAQILDPLSGEQVQALGMLMETIFILLFLSANGHHLFLMTLSKSYESFPIAATPDIETLTNGIITASSTMLLLSLKMATPLLAAFLLILVVLAVMARIAPETNILFLSLPLRVGVGLLTVSLMLPFINAFVKDFAELMNRMVPV